MDDCKNCSEINTVYFTNRFKHSREIMAPLNWCNWCHQITDFFQYIHFWSQQGIISPWLSSYLSYSYDISLLQLLFCKNTVNLKECVAAFALLFCYSSNGWLQLELRINSIPLKKGKKKHTTLENTRSLQKTFWKDNGTAQIYAASAPLK